MSFMGIGLMVVSQCKLVVCELSSVPKRYVVQGRAPDLSLGAPASHSPRGLASRRVSDSLALPEWE